MGWVGANDAQVCLKPGAAPLSGTEAEAGGIDGSTDTVTDSISIVAIYYNASGS